MIIVMVRFTVANDRVDELRAASHDGLHLVDGVPGVLGMAIINSCEYRGTMTASSKCTRWAKKGRPTRCQWRRST
jgi:hypothetical protein